MTDKVPDIDQDLIDLLNEVEASSKPKLAPQQPPKLKAPKNESEAKVVETKPIEQKITKSEPEIKPIEQKVAKEVQIAVQESSDNMLIDDSAIMTSVRDKVINICSNVIDYCHNDREQIQKVINMLMEKVEFGGEDGRVSDVFVEQLVNALRSKSEVNEISVKAADNLVKLLGATKRSTNIKTNNTLNIDSHELKELLNKANKV